MAIAAITAAELLVGVELADEARREARAGFVEGLLAILPVEEYDLAVARAHSTLLAYTHSTGTMRGAHDLIIAATALTHARIVLSADSSAFEGLPGVRFKQASIA